MNFTDIDREDLRQYLKEVQNTMMPFGRFGPKECPPSGVPIYDLPPEYLAWFSERGFPQGQLGELMRMTHEIKSCGADEIFTPLRRARGGRSSVRKRKPNSSFNHDDS